MCLDERSLKFYVHLNKNAGFHIIQVLMVEIVADKSPPSLESSCLEEELD